METPALCKKYRIFLWSFLWSNNINFCKGRERHLVRFILNLWSFLWSPPFNIFHKSSLSAIFRRTGKSAKYDIYTKKSGANYGLTTIRTGFYIPVYESSSFSSSTSHNISSICWEFIAVLSSYVPGFSLSL